MDGLEQQAPGIETLITRMRSGDREAAGLFLERYGDRVRRRIRGKLSPAMRRLFDSQEILSTVARRLDRCVSGGELAASEPAQLWALVFRIAETSVIDKGRVYRRLRSAEAPDRQFAGALQSRLSAADRRAPEGCELELDSVLRSLETPLDREILSQWLRGLSHDLIAEELELKAPMVRKRFERIKRRLRREMAGGTA
ncbi:MAG: RNA polymerase sigma factor [Phycisphaerales bacterium JB039]